MSYSISSDQHAHSWSQFARTDSDGINSRLRVILNELVRQAEMTKARGHKRMILAGDLFHVRGRIEPSVFNPTMDTFKAICAMGIEVDAIAGNHDLEGKDATALGNAMQQLSTIKGFTAHVKPVLKDDLLFVPWIENVDQLRKVLAKLAGHKRASEIDVIIHAPVDGVLKGLPDHGLKPAELKALGFRRVWSGHYHNAMDFGDGVYSVGATSHQTWGDPGTKAGFWVVDGTRALFEETRAPLFKNFKEGDNPDDYVGAYARIQLSEVTSEELEAARAALRDAGALGIVDHSSRKRTSSRGGTTAKAGASLEASVGAFIDKDLKTDLDKGRVTTMALDVLNEARNRLAA